MQRVGRYQISYIANVTVSKLIIFYLYSDTVALDVYNSTKSEVFITKLFRWVEVMFTIFRVDLDFFPNLEIALHILDNGQVF